jgi:hypothetical protein
MEFRFPLIVFSGRCDFWLIGVNTKDPAAHFEPWQAEEGKVSIWDATGRRLWLRKGPSAGRLELVSGSEEDSGPALEALLVECGKFVGWGEDGAELLSRGVPYPLVARYLLWAAKSKRAPSDDID